MSDDELDLDLLALLRERLGLNPSSATLPPSTGILKSAEYIYDNSIDVSIVHHATKLAAKSLWEQMQQSNFSTQAWSEHDLHPKAKDESTLNFIFTMDLLNFSFWSELSEETRFAVEYKNRRYTGYQSLVAALQRALDEGFPVTTPSYWSSATDEQLQHIFRSVTAEPMPLLEKRVTLLRDTAETLDLDFNGSIVNIIEEADNSAARLVNILTDHFAGFRDIHTFHGKSVKLHKRAQILVADIWACFNGESYGHFDDIEHITIFPDYRIPQMLQSLGVLWYSPRLEGKIRRKEIIESGSEMEVEIRGCSIWAVELLRREMQTQFPESKGKVNAILIDFFLYDTCKDQEKKAQAEGIEEHALPHHRTRSIWY